MKKRKTACFGGTFDVPLHKGHEILISRAFEIAEFCYIGLTSDDYLLRKRKEGVRSFDERRNNLMHFLASKKINKKRYEITRLENFFGSEVIDPKSGIEAIVVSEKTMPGALGINILREDAGLKPLEIVQVEMVMAKDGRPISSGRIRAREIDQNGEGIGK